MQASQVGSQLVGSAIGKVSDVLKDQHVWGFKDGGYLRTALEAGGNAGIAAATGGNAGAAAASTILGNIAASQTRQLVGDLAGSLTDNPALRTSLTNALSNIIASGAGAAGGLAFGTDHSTGINALSGAAAASAIQQYNQANEDQDTEEERRVTEEQRANGRRFLSKTAWIPVLAGPSDLGLAVIDGAEGHYSDVAQDLVGMAMDLSLPFSLAAPVEKVVLFGGEEIGLDFFLDRKYSPLRGDPREIPQERLPEGTREENLRVFAEGKIGDTILRDVNQKARNPEGFDEDAETALFDIVREKITKSGRPKPNGTAGSAHAEIGLLQQALDKGIADGAHLDMTVYGRPICSFCLSDVPKMADRVGLSSMRIRSFSRKDGIYYEVFHDWNPGTKLEENKPMRTILGPSKEK